MMKSKAARKRRVKGKGGGESPCRSCNTVKLKPARNRKGQFAKKGKR